MDDEYNISDVFSSLLNTILLDCDDLYSLVNKLYDFELAQEIKHTYLDPHIVEKIKSYDCYKIGYISDFYANTSFLDTILEKNGFPYVLSFKYVSCEHMLNKRSGRLYEKVLKDLKIQPGDITHIGDNEYSDYQVPNRFGINAEIYAPLDEVKKRKKKESLFSIEHGINQNVIEEFKAKDNTVKQLAPFFTSFVLWINEECIKNDIKKLFFFTREGEFFIKIQKLIENSGIFYDLLPDSKILEVSRVATFAPSIRETTIKEFMRIWNQYSTQSMGAFAKSLGLDILEFSNLIEFHNLNLEEEIQYPWLDNRVKELFKDERFINYLDRVINNKKTAFLGYLEQKGIDIKLNEKIAIVDIGWRGTIQDNISYLLRSKTIFGYYLGLEDFLNEQPFNTRKEGFINDQYGYKQVLRFVAPIEMVTNSPNGSTIRYEYINGYYKAVRKNETSEDEVFNKFTCRIQDSILNECVNILKIINLHFLNSYQLKAYSYLGFYNLIMNPYSNKDIVNAFFNLCHNEEFGVGRFIDKKVKFQLMLFFMSLFSKTKRTKLRDFLFSTSWPQGYFVKFNLHFLIGLFNNKLRKND